MMMHTIESERAKYQKIWDFKPYGDRSPGLRHLAGAMEWMQPASGSTITDWGSGSGQAADAMHEQGYRVRMVDIAPNAYRGKHSLEFVEACLWTLPDDLEPTDYGFCADVMEHLPPEFIDQTLGGIAARTRKKCYFQIALFDDRTFTHAGPLHLSVFEPEWWQAKICLFFRSAEFRRIQRKHLLVVAAP